MNRNTKRYPQEEIISLKKRGKRLRGGYLLAKLKNWKSSGSKPEIERPKTIKPKPLTTKRKTEPKQKIEAKGRAIPKSIEIKPIKAKKTISKQPKQKVEAKGRAIPKSIEIKPVEKKVRKTRQKSVNKIVVEKIKQAEQKPVETEKKVRKARQQSVNKVVVEKIKQAEQKPVETDTKRTIVASSFIDELHDETIFEKYGILNTEKYVNQIIKDLLPEIPQKSIPIDKGIELLTEKVIEENKLIKYFGSKSQFTDEDKNKLKILIAYYVIYTAGFDGSTRKKDAISQEFLNKLNNKYSKIDYILSVPNVSEKYTLGRQNKEVKVDDKTLQKIASLMSADDRYRPAMDGGYVDMENGVVVFTNSYTLLKLPIGSLNISRKLQDKTIYNFANKKGYKDIIDERFPPYQNVVPDKDFRKKVMTLNVDQELEKCKRFKFLSKYVEPLGTQESFGKIIYPNELYIKFSYKLYEKCLETLKLLGKTTFEFYCMKNDREEILLNKPIMLVSDEIEVLLMPVRQDPDELRSFDNAVYNYDKINDGVIEYIDPIKLSINNTVFNPQNKELVKLGDELNSNDTEQQALFDNFNPNTEQELQAIAKDIPAFGDDVNEEKFDVDGKYNLPEVVQKRDNMEVASVKDIKTMRFKALTLPSKYRQLLGKVPANFRMLLWGSPGHGKSSLALTIANDIGKYQKTLYVSAEESLQSATLSSRIKRFKANARNLMFNDTNNPDILDKIIMTQNPKFVVIDSVNVMIGKTEAIINLMLKYPEVGFIIIAQATKDKKKYAGLGSLAHAVDIVVNVRSGMAVAEKNRYAQLGSMPVKGIKI